MNSGSRVSVLLAMKGEGGWILIRVVQTNKSTNVNFSALYHH